MKRKIKLLCAVVMTSIFTMGLYVPNTLAAENKSLNHTRVNGNDRYETSASIAEIGWNDGTENVVIASGESYADALCAAPLAKSKNAPILLTSKNELNTKVKEEIKKLKAKNVTIIGGEGAISSQVEEEIEAISGIEDVKRISGKDRYETSLKIAQELKEVENVVIATGSNYADALSIAPIAAQEKMPILLVSKDKIDNNIKDYINNIQKLNKVYVVGGEGVISEKVADSLSKSVRISGSNRYETNIKVLEQFKEKIDFSKAYVATASGENGFADALSGAVLASLTKSPLILVGDSLDKDTQKFISKQFSSKTKLSILGGKGVVSEDIVEEIKEEIENSEKSENNQGSSSGSSSGGSSGGSHSHDDEPEKPVDKKISAKASINKNEVVFKIKNVKDSSLTINVFQKETKKQVINYILSGIDSEEATYVCNLAPGNYYFYVEGEKSGKTDTEYFTVLGDMKAEVTTSGKSFKLSISNIIDNELVIKIYNKDNKCVFETKVLNNEIKDGKYEFTKELNEGAYYAVIEGEKAGKVQTDVFLLKVIMTTQVTVSEDKIVTLRVNNLVDKELTMILYDEKGNVVHAAYFVGSHGITQKDLDNGYYEYKFGIDDGTYNGYVRGEKAGKAEISTFTVE